MAITKRMGEGFTLLTECWSLIVSHGKLLMVSFLESALICFMVNDVVALIRGLKLKEYIFLPDTEWQVLWKLAQIDRAAGIVYAAKFFILYVLVFIVGMTFVWLVNDALHERPLMIINRLIDSVRRIFTFPWLLLFILSIFVFNLWWALLMGVPLLVKKKQSNAKLFGRAVELYLGNVPELIGAGIASILIMLVGIAVITVTTAPFIALMAPNLAAVESGLIVGFGVMCWLTTTAYAAVPVVIVEKSK